MNPRRVLAEFLGTALLVMAVVGSGIMAQNLTNDVGLQLLANAIATGGARNAGPRWSDCMWPWEETPSSFADGILDDETYDWISVLDAMADTGGSPVVVTEDHLHRAYDLVRNVGGFNSCATGISGFAGVLAMRENISDDERIVVIVSGVSRL